MPMQMLSLLTNNVMMHLFSNIRYQLSSQKIESFFYCGRATTTLGLLKYPDDCQTNMVQRFSHGRTMTPALLIDKVASFKSQIQKTYSVLGFH